MAMILEPDEADTLQRVMPAMPPEQQAQAAGLIRQYNTEKMHAMVTDPATVDKFAPSLAELTATASDPDALRGKIANIAFLSDKTGVPGSTIADAYEPARDAYAAQNFGETNVDDNKFHALAKQAVSHDMAQSDMLQTGPDSLLGMAHSAGIAGKDYTQAFADWQDAHIDSDSYDTAKTGTYFDGGRQQYEASLAAGHNGEYNRLAERTLALVDGAQEMTKDGNLVAPDMSYADRQRLTVDLALYPPEVRRNIIYPLIIAKAQAQGLDPKSAFRGIDSAMRGFDTLVQGSTQAAFRVGAGVLGGVASMMGNEDGVRLAKAVNQQQLVYGELTQLANGTIDPIKKTGTGWLPDAVNTLGGLVPYVVTGGLGFGGAAGKMFPALSSPAVMSGLRVAGAAAMATGFASDISNQLKWDHPNMDQGAADTIGIVSGTAQALLSGLPGKWLSEGAPGVARLLARYASPEAGAATRFGAGFLGQAVSHGATFGVAIPATTPFVQELVSTVNSTVPGVKLGDEVQKMWQNLPSTIVPVLVLSLLGAGRATMEGPATAAKMGEGFINDPNALQMLGFNDAQAAAIRGAKDPVAALQAEYPNRANDVSSMMAAGKAYSDQVKAGQQTTQSLEESGALSVIAHPASDQWSITTKDGSKVTFPDWQSADAARWQHMADNRISGATDAPAASTDSASTPTAPPDSPQASTPVDKTAPTADYEANGQQGSNLLDAAIQHLQGVDSAIHPLEADSRGVGDGAEANQNSGRGERAYSSGTGARSVESRRLEGFADANQASLTEGWLDSLEKQVGGNEHVTYTDPEQKGWRIKVTGPDLRFQTGQPRREASVSGYLKRWQLANQVFGDKAQLLGIIKSEQGNSIVMRQPEMVAADPENPHPTKPEINAWLRKAGFEYQSGSWVRDADGVVLSDEHEGNFIKTKDGIRPIDLHIHQLESKAGAPVIPWDENPANPAQSSKVDSGTDPNRPATENGKPDTANGPPSPSDLQQRAKAAGVQITPQMEEGLRNGHPKVIAAVEHLTSAQEDLARTQDGAPNAEVPGSAQDKPAILQTDPAANNDGKPSDSVSDGASRASDPDKPAGPPDDSLRTAAIAGAASDPTLTTPDEKAVAQRFADKIASDLPAFTQWYHENFGNVLDLDAIRSYSDDYAASPEARRKYTEATKAVSGKAVGYLFDQLLLQPSQKGIVRFNAGGMASGKSTSIMPENSARYDFTLDTTLGNCDLARSQIQSVLDTGRKVSINFVYAPFEQAMEDMIHRSLGEGGRYVSVPKMAHAHHAAARNALKLASEFGPGNVMLEVINNTRVGENYLGEKRSAQWLQQHLNPDIDTLTQKGKNITHEQWNKHSGEPAYTEALRQAILAEH